MQMIKKIKNIKITWPWALCIIFCCAHAADAYIEYNISAQRVEYVDGCVVKSHLAHSRAGGHSVIATSFAGEELVFITRNSTQIKFLAQHLGQCYRFSFYRHSYLTPYKGWKMLLDFKEIPPK